MAKHKVYAYDVAKLKPDQHALHYRGKVQAFGLILRRMDSVKIEAGRIDIAFPSIVMLTARTYVDSSRGHVTIFKWAESLIEYQTSSIVAAKVRNKNDEEITIPLKFAWAIENTEGKILKADLSARSVEP